MACTTQQLYNFLQGCDITGESSYDIWLSLNPNGTKEEFLEYIRSAPQGEQGLQGKSAYEVWLELDGNQGKSKEEFLIQ